MGLYELGHWLAGGVGGVGRGLVPSLYHLGLFGDK